MPGICLLSNKVDLPPCAASLWRVGNTNGLFLPLKIQGNSQQLKPVKIKSANWCTKLSGGMADVKEERRNKQNAPYMDDIKTTYGARLMAAAQCFNGYPCGIEAL
jgi:hypothetical protein